MIDAMAPKLSPGEQILFEGHPSWRAILAFYAKGIALTLLAALIAAGVTRIGGDVKSGVVGAVAVIGVAITLLAGFIRRVTTSYTITDRRLHITRGVISRDVQETRLERVQNVNYSQGLLQRVLQVGDVDFDTAGGDDYGFTFAGVANPEQVTEQVDRATARTGHELGDTQPPPAAPASS
jgi:uncharacterized membrane protein YdbT with pleckstrin-like domain